jgi:SAM-dependent methyltransferase
MRASLRSDRAYLKNVAYADPTGLAARASLYEYQLPKLDLDAAVLGAAGDLPGRRVADVGCGPGRYLTVMASRGAWVVGLDLSSGMLRGLATDHLAVAAADAAAIPLTAGFADVVLACHTLYHLPDPDRGLSEMHRVLRPGGRLVATVAGPGHLAEMDQLWSPLLGRAGLDTADANLALTNDRLPAAVLGSLLEHRFARTRREDLVSAVVVTDPDPVVRHAASTAGALAASRVAGPQLLSQFRGQIAARIERNGTFRLTTSVSLFSAVRA